MKRTVLVLIAFLLAIIPAMADQTFSPFEYVTGSAGGGRYIYYDFPDVTLNLPAEWEGLFTVERDDAGASFYQTASLEKYAEEGIPGGGFLFRLCASEDESFRELPAFEYLGYSENVDLHFYLELPSDYPAWPDDDIRTEYDEMASRIDLIVEKARVAPNMSFYPGNTIAEDGNGLA